MHAWLVIVGFVFYSFTIFVLGMLTILKADESLESKTTKTLQIIDRGLQVQADSVRTEVVVLHKRVNEQRDYINKQIEKTMLKIEEMKIDLAQVQVHKCLPLPKRKYNKKLVEPKVEHEVDTSAK